MLNKNSRQICYNTKQNHCGVLQNMNDVLQAKKDRFCGISAGQLRIIALVAMLLDHLWATVISDNLWMTCIGRIAFPIFAFQLAEGAVLTSDINAYAKRLLKYALISEIPFNLLMGGSIINPFHQNVMFTLLLGLLGIRSVQQAKTAQTKKTAFKHGLLIILFGLLSIIGFVDYGLMGYVTILSFYLLRDFKFAKLGQFIVLFLLNQVLFSGFGVPVSIMGHEFFFYYQCFAVLALIPIWLYNGNQGRHSAFIRKFSYIFYPAHMLAIYAVWLLFM